MRQDRRPSIMGSRERRDRGPGRARYPKRRRRRRSRAPQVSPALLIRRATEGRDIDDHGIASARSAPPLAGAGGEAVGPAPSAFRRHAEPRQPGGSGSLVIKPTGEAAADHSPDPTFATPNGSSAGPSFGLAFNCFEDARDRHSGRSLDPPPLRVRPCSRSASRLRACGPRPAEFAYCGCRNSGFTRSFRSASLIFATFEPAPAPS